MMDFVVEVGDVGERVGGGVKADSQHQKQKQTKNGLSNSKRGLIYSNKMNGYCCIVLIYSNKMNGYCCIVTGLLQQNEWLLLYCAGLLQQNEWLQLYCADLL